MSGKRGRDEPVIHLYSGSRARAELLRGAGLRVNVIPMDVDETPPEGASPGETVLALASRKLDAALSSAAGAADRWGLAADTLVEGPEGLLGKPEDRESARRMLACLSGRCFRVYSALALYAPKGGIRRAVHDTAVEFRDCSDWEIQGRGAFFAVSINGLMSTAAGLPLSPLYAILMEASYPFGGGPVGG